MFNIKDHFKLSKKRKFFIIISISFIFFVLVGMQVINWWLYVIAESVLSTEIDRRLKFIARKALKLFSYDDISFIMLLAKGEENSPHYKSIQKKLENFKNQYDLADIYVIDKSIRYLVTLYNTYEFSIGTPCYLPEQEINNVKKCLKGEIMLSSERPLDVPLKTAYVAIKDEHGFYPGGIIVIEFNPTFFKEFRILKRNHIITAVVSSAILLGLIIVFIFIVNHLIKSEQKIAETERLAKMGKFATGIAHELKNPLGIINGYLNLLEEDLKEKDMLDTVAEIKMEVKRMTEFINEFLLFARPIQMTFETVNLNEYIKQIVSKVKLMAPSGVTIEEKYEKENLRVNIDKEHIMRAILNIVRNAFEAKKVEADLKVLIKTEKIYGRISKKWFAEIEIRDTGKGIAKEQLDKIFIPFETSKPSGTGLGLAMTKKIIEEHNGKILIESEVEKGTSFFLYLPLLTDCGISY